MIRTPNHVGTSLIYIWSADEEIEPFLPDLSAESTDATVYAANPTPYQA